MSSRTNKQPRNIRRPQATPSVKTSSEIQTAAAAAAAEATLTSATVAPSLDSLASGTLIAATRRRRKEEPGCFEFPLQPSPPSPPPQRRSAANSGRIALALVALGWPLRSIYCLAALVSLLLLIVYIHQASAQSTAADQQRVKMLQVELRPQSSSSGSGSAQERSMALVVSPKNSQTPASASRNSSTKGGHRSLSSGPISKRPPSSGAGRHSSAELTFRQAGGGDYSENNRGSPAASRAPASSSQRHPVADQNNEQPWRPIVGQRAQQPPPPPPASGEARRVAAPAANLPPVPAAAPSNAHETMDRFHIHTHHQLPAPAHHRSQSAAHREHHHHQHQHHQHHHSHSNHRTHSNNNNNNNNIRHTNQNGASEGRRTWRRPRLNQQLLAHEMLPVASDFRPPPPPQPLGKMYKRVLICDKTLVSLDYVREFALEPRPFPMAHYFDAPFDDNVIDLDLRSDLLDRRAASASSLVYTTSSSSNSNNMTTTILDTGSSGAGGGNTTIAPAGQSIGQAAAPAAPTIEDEAAGDLAVGASALGQPAERRQFAFGAGGGAPANLLPDEDALVKCDMWDLEKGLKNRKPPGEILELAVRADFDTVRDAINRCRQLTEKSLPPDDELRGDGLEIMSTEDLISLFSMKRGLLPGTKWCGLGDMASTYNDLGPKHRIDICCRAHDHCPIRLKPFRNDYGVLNIALYTKSHCDCDADFYRCLREAHSRTADMLGNLYFNVMKLQCIREERLKVCREMRPIALGFERCVRYEENPMKRVFKFTTPPVAY